MRLITKDPQSIEPRGFDWTSYLAELGADVIIDTSTWEVEGADDDLALSADSIVTGGLMTQVKLSAGTEGVTYTVTNHIVASDGTEDDRSLQVLIEHQ